MMQITFAHIHRKRRVLGTGLCRSTASTTCTSQQSTSYMHRQWRAWTKVRQEWHALCRIGMHVADISCHTCSKDT